MTIKGEQNMNPLLHRLYSGTIPFCVIQKQDSEDVLVLTGDTSQYRHIHDIPRKSGSTNGKCVYDTISVVPFCQIRERNCNVRDNGEKIPTIQITEHCEVPADDLINTIPNEEILLRQEIEYDFNEEQYCRIIQSIVENEIGNGEGANFVIPRNAQGMIDSFSVGKAFFIF
jgi:phenazine biosynthesis protein phzE